MSENACACVCACLSFVSLLSTGPRSKEREGAPSQQGLGLLSQYLSSPSPTAWDYTRHFSVINLFNLHNTLSSVYCNLLLLQISKQRLRNAVHCSVTQLVGSWGRI